MLSHHRLKLAIALACATAAPAGRAPAQLVTGFEAPSYTTGSLQFQDNWDLGTAGRSPRVQTAAEIAAELTAAGLNPANPVHSGDQALLMAKMDTATETSGYFVRDIFSGLDTETHVRFEWWARPLTTSTGGDPTGVTPGTGTTIGERQGNTFVGLANTAGEIRAAAIRFGVDQAAGTQPVDQNITERHIDFASASAGSAVWVKSGLLWQPDHWYNFRLDLDYSTKKYDVYVDGVKANSSPIRFYTETSDKAQRFFVSRGTNQAGQILDDLSVTAFTPTPFTAGDFDQDHDVDGADFLVWQRNNSVGNLSDWQTNYGATSALAAVSSVPEPTGLALAAGFVLAGLGLCSKRK